MSPAALAALEQAVRAVVLDDGRTDMAAGRALRDHPKLTAAEKAEVVRRAYAFVRQWRLVRHVAGLDGALREAWATGVFAPLCVALELVEGVRPETVPPAFSPAVARRRLDEARAKGGALAYSLPDWLAEKLRVSLGRRFDKVCAALLEESPCALRVNTRKGDAVTLAARLRAEGVATRPFPGLPFALEAADRHAALRSRAFADGFFELQDSGSQRVAPYLMPSPGLRVIDACAGEGGKTLHLSNLMEGRGRILAMDVDARKLDTLRERAARADAQNIATRLVSPEAWRELAGTADRVLVDAPCSGTGVLRRQPETKWRLTPEGVAERVALQAAILSGAAFAAKPAGGLVVYATCSLLSEENEGQVARFLARHPGAFELEEQRRVLPGVDGDCDGFFMARLRRLA